ncbi:MAG TPA: alkaline phosphatase D family protein [Usitatibacter sp.]|nr:alkaline phosphatase D family protein [Usitatibacter sp.]
MRSLPKAGRRAFLERALALGAAGFLQPLAGCASREVRFASHPFTLGVASGSPRPDGVVLWTRLAPAPLEGGGMDPVPVDVRWEVAEDEAFRRVVRSGTQAALPAAAHTVHVEVDGLAPAREYWYRFFAGAEASPEARTRTAPAPGHGDERLRLALASCQQYEQGWYVAHRHLAAEGVDLVAFVGDYIYESSWGGDHVRHHASGEPYTLAQYRDRYAQYKTDPDLQRSHACAPWIVTWDDHEVDNDYANDRAEDLEPDFLARRAAAYQAFLEHLPVRASLLRPMAGEYRIYGRHSWGSLARLHVLDDRQYRSHEVCPRPGRGGSNVVGPECAERLDPSRTILGERQERWFEEGMARSRAAWNIVVQQTLMATAGRPSARGLLHWTDGWDGYPAARERLLAAIERTRARNPVVLGGDVHANYVADLRVHPERMDTPVVATEFCGTSITSQGLGAGIVREIAAANPHILFAESTKRGYVVLDFARGHLETRLRTVASVKDPDSPISTRATFAVEDGHPGARAA